MDDIEAVCRDLKQDALMVVAVTPYFRRHQVIDGGEFQAGSCNRPFLLACLLVAGIGWQ